MDGDKTFSVGTAASRRSVWRGGKMTWANRGCRVFEKTCTWSLVPEDTRCRTSTLCTTSCSWNILNWQLQLENWVIHTFTFSSVLTQVIPFLCAGVNRRYRAALQAVLRCRSGDAFHSSLALPLGEETEGSDLPSPLLSLQHRSFQSVFRGNG